MRGCGAEQIDVWLWHTSMQAHTSETKCHCSCWRQPLKPLTSPTMALVGEGYEGPSSAVVVFTQSSSLREGSQPEGDGPLSQMKAVFFFLGNATAVNHVSVHGPESCAHEDSRPPWTAQVPYESHQGCDPLERHISSVSASDAVWWYALSQTIVSVLKILQPGLSKHSSFLVESVGKWRDVATGCCLCPLEWDDSSLIFQQMLPAIFIKERIYGDNSRLKCDGEVIEDNVFNVVW